MISSRPFRFAARAALALLVAGTVLTAPNVAFADSSKQPAITEARADGGMLFILGVNFGGGMPKVTLGKLPLSVIAMSATQIDALIPASVAPGSYLLTVSPGNGKKGDDGNDDGKYDEFWVTIGAAGPQGPVGPVGPVGAAGPQGAMGLAGLQGTPGAAGAAGPQGLTGPSGLQGPVGLQGAQGVAGKDGTKGASGNDGATGPAGRDGERGPAGAGGPMGPAGMEGVRGAEGASGPPGPQGPPGSGGSPFAIESLAGVPCTVAMCPGTTAATFDRISSSLVLSCVTIPATNTLRIQGTLAVSQTITGDEVLSFTSDVQGFAGEIPYRSNLHGGPVAFDVPANNLCSGRAVVVTVTRSRGSLSPAPSLNLDGGSCKSAPLDLAPAVELYVRRTVSVTCSFTMNGNQTLTIDK